MTEAMLYRREEGGAVSCFLCSHRCRIAEGKRGRCKVRKNRGGTLESLIYGRVIARNNDPIEKKPLYHFLPGSRSYSIATPGCNFRCSFCQNWQISQTESDIEFGAIPFIEPAAIVAEAVRAGSRSISYTYTEPTIFMEYALACAALAKKSGLKNVFVTNGYQTPEAVEAMRGLIDAANVDLKGFTEEFYRRHCQAKLAPVLDAIVAMYEAGIHVEVTTLIVPGRNDAEAELRGIAAFLARLSPDLPWHISRFHPDYEEMDIEATPFETMVGAEAAGREAGLRYVYLGNVLTVEGQDTRCPGCSKVLVKRRGLGSTEVLIEEPSCPACGHPIPVVLA
jgi:pyruvate formate lyase activating enzyme